MCSKKLLLIGLFVLAIIGFARKEAMAVTQGGTSLTCTKNVPCPDSAHLACFCLGSVDGGFLLEGTQLTGNTVSMTVRASDGVIACGAPGNDNPAGGIQITHDTDFESFSVSTAIKKDQIKANKVTGILGADISDGDLQDAAQKFCPSGPGSNWTGLAYAACVANITLEAKDTEGNTRASKTYSCTTDCTTLGFTVDPLSKTFSFNPTEYSCVAQ